MGFEAFGGYAAAGAQLGSDWTANLANINQARINRQWQLDMSSTAYQRTVADLKAAGLNPMLAVQQGPNSWGPGSAATNLGGGQVGNVAASAARLATIDKQRVDNETKLADAEVNRKEAETDNLYLTRGLISANMKQAIASAAKINAEEPGARAMSNILSRLSGYGDRFFDMVNKLIDAKQTAKGGFNITTDLGDAVADAVQGKSNDPAFQILQGAAGQRLKALGRDTLKAAGDWLGRWIGNKSSTAQGVLGNKGF